MAYAKTHTTISLKEYYIHNSDTIEKQQFFKDNVLVHSKRDDLTVNLMGRQRCSDMRTQPNLFVLSHLRFVDRKAYLLDCVWNGIPVVHNSKFLYNIGLGLERLWYNDNSIINATKAMEK